MPSVVIMSEPLGRPCLPSADFRLVVCDHTHSPDAVRDLASGHIPAVLVEDVLTTGECEKLVARFWSHPERTAREDGVAGDYIGAYHYAKQRDAYLDEAARFHTAIDTLFAGISDPRKMIADALARLPHRPQVRLASWAGRAASPARALSWNASGDYLLEPHDDVGQLHDPLQEGFEIQQTAERPLLAVNIYPHVPPGGGLLRLWNFRPTQADRRKLAIERTGYPYPQQILAGLEYFDIPVRTGTMAIIDGRFVHAVTAYKKTVTGPENRLLINTFYGQLDSGNFVYWV